MRLVTRRCIRLLGALGLCACTAACTEEHGAPEDAEPCSLDALGCGAALRFEVDDQCELSEPLRIAMGHGDNGLFPFLPAEAPHLGNNSGGGQGAAVRHVALAVRVDNPDEDHRVFQVQFLLEEPLFEVGAAGSGGTDTPEWASVEERRVVLGEGNMRDGEDGALEQWGLNLLLECPSCLSGVARLRTTVRDSCDRRAEAIHEFVWPSEDSER